MARKKIVFVIVEGPSDDAALGVILNRIYDKSTVHVEIMHGDITSDLKTTPNNIIKSLGNLIRKYALSMHFTQNDFQEVIHLVDMDGIYIPNSAIVYNSEADRPIYSLTEIQTAKEENIILRNQRKRNNLNVIMTLDKVWKSIPYRVYYMSCNLDHALYGKLNCSDEDKENNAYLFAKRYKDDIKGFLSFISDSEFSRIDGYRESWNFIKEELHSLERFTNLGLCFSEIRKNIN